MERRRDLFQPNIPLNMLFKGESLQIELSEDEVDLSFPPEISMTKCSLREPVSVSVTVRYFVLLFRRGPSEGEKS